MRQSILCVAVLCSCGVAELDETAVDSSEAHQKEEWSQADAPYLFTPDFESHFDALPLSGEAAHVPWPGSYWPTSEDVINYRWAGDTSDSPAKKYERAFGGANVEDAVSRAHGIDSATAQATCTTDAQCSAARSEVCAKRRGHTSGRCIPTWWGICHAWTPAAILLPEPRNAVTRNGVRFEVQDLKALASLVYDRSSSRFVSLRCNTAASTFAFDHYGRPVASECRDTNAGTWHVLLANYLGRLRQSFAEDRTIGSEVWNQPLRSFRVVSKHDVTAAQANTLLGATGTTYAFDSHAVRFVDVVSEVKFIAESEPDQGYVGVSGADAFTRSDHYEYVLELDSAGRIIGGEWVGTSRSDHPDFVWLPIGPAAATVAGGAIRFDAVKAMVLESAGAPTGGVAGGATRTETVTLARDGWKFLGPYSTAAGPIAVDMTGTGDADLFVRMGAQASSALYDCRPWLSSSNESCALSGPGPLYVAVHGYTAASVTVKVKYTAGPYAARLLVNSNVALGELKTYAVVVSAGKALTIRSTAAHDVDLYVKLGAAPTLAVHEAAADTPSGNETLRYVPHAAGTLYIGVHGYAASTFSLNVSEE